MKQEPNDPHSIGSSLSATVQTELERLDAEYRATSYLMFLPEYTVALRVGEPSPVLDDWLSHNGYKSWAFVSAYNPRSQPLNEEANRTRHQQLIERVEARRRRWTEAMGCPDGNDWKPEFGLFLPGISRKDALALAARFKQNAILFGLRGEAPQLVYLDLEA